MPRHPCTYKNKINTIYCQNSPCFSYSNACVRSREHGVTFGLFFLLPGPRRPLLNNRCSIWPTCLIGKLPNYIWILSPEAKLRWISKHRFIRRQQFAAIPLPNDVSDVFPLPPLIQWHVSCFIVLELTKYTYWDNLLVQASAVLSLSPSAAEKCSCRRPIEKLLVSECTGLDFDR